MPEPLRSAYICCCRTVAAICCLSFAASNSERGGAWGGCVYDVDEILKVLAAGRKVMT